MSPQSLPAAGQAVLLDRAIIDVNGPDWRPFLQGLITQDVETLTPGAMRYGALLTPQGRVLYDLFLLGTADGVRLDAPAEHRDTLLAKLKLYRLRAKVELAASEDRVQACWGHTPARDGWMQDPRLGALGWRCYGAPQVLDGVGDYDAHRLVLGIPDLLRDGLSDKDYALEANLDLLNGVDFKKGCFVGQETTSRMKRRTTVRSRLTPITFDGAPPPPGSEVLAGELRAGEVRSGREGRALALLRLDRAAGANLTVQGRPVHLNPPSWLRTAFEAAAAPA